MLQPGDYALLILVPTISIIGALGNFVVLTFYLRRTFSSSPTAKFASSSPVANSCVTANTFILVLSANDFIASVVVMPLTLIYELSPQIMFQTDLACKFYLFITTSVIPFSAFLIIAISVERYFWICHPLKVILTHSRARIVVFVLAIIASIMGLIVAVPFGLNPDVRATSSSQLGNISLDSFRLIAGNLTSFQLPHPSVTPPPPFFTNSFKDLSQLNNTSSFSTTNSNNNNKNNKKSNRLINRSSGSGTSSRQNNAGDTVSSSATAPSVLAPASASTKTIYSVLELLSMSSLDINETSSYLAVDSFLGSDSMTNNADLQYCTRKNLLPQDFVEAYQIIHNAIIFGLALTVPFVIYALIYIKLSARQRDRHRRKTASTRVLLQNTSMPNITITRPSNDVSMSGLSSFGDHDDETDDNNHQSNDDEKQQHANNGNGSIVNNNNNGDANWQHAVNSRTNSVTFADDEVDLSTAGNGFRNSLGSSSSENGGCHNHGGSAVLKKKSSFSNTNNRKSLTQQQLLEKVQEDTELLSNENGTNGASCNNGGKVTNGNGNLYIQRVSKNDSTTSDSAVLKQLQQRHSATAAGTAVRHVASLPTSPSMPTSPSNLSSTMSAQTTDGSTNKRQSVTFRIGGERSSQIRLAVMLFVVTVVFAVSYAPGLIANYTGIISDPSWKTFVFYLYFVNNAANPIIYGVMNRNFREELIKQFATCQ